MACELIYRFFPPSLEYHNSLEAKQQKSMRIEGIYIHIYSFTLKSFTNGICVFKAYVTLEPLCAMRFLAYLCYVVLVVLMWFRM